MYDPGANSRKENLDRWPFAETKELVAGYWLIRVKSLAEAMWSKQLPTSPDRETEIEVREYIELQLFALKAVGTAARGLLDRCNPLLTNPNSGTTKSLADYVNFPFANKLAFLTGRRVLFVGPETCLGAIADAIKI